MQVWINGWVWFSMSTMQKPTSSLLGSHLCCWTESFLSDSYFLANSQRLQLHQWGKIWIDTNLAVQKRKVDGSSKDVLFLQSSTSLQVNLCSIGRTGCMGAPVLVKQSWHITDVFLGLHSIPSSSLVWRSMTWSLDTESDHQKLSSSPTFILLCFASCRPASWEYTGPLWITMKLLWRQQRNAAKPMLSLLKSLR